jgi:hypothetical protein
MVDWLSEAVLFAAYALLISSWVTDDSLNVLMVGVKYIEESNCADGV